MEKQFGIFRLNTDHRLTLKKKIYWLLGTGRGAGFYEWLQARTNAERLVSLEILRISTWGSEKIQVEA